MFKKSFSLCLLVFLCLLMFCPLVPQASAADMYLNPTAGYPIMGDSTAVGNVMTIRSNGNVGIGTTAPAYKFVVSNAGAEALEVGTYYSGEIFLQGFNRTGFLYNIMRYNAADHRFEISGSEKVRINSNGNVGIGTTAPGIPLEVVGNIYSRTGSAIDLGTVYGSLGALKGLQLSESDLTTTLGIFARQYSEAYGFDIWQRWAGGIDFPMYIDNRDPSAIIFRTNTYFTDAGEKMRIAGDGKVGIGTTAPGAALEVSSANGPQLFLNSSNSNGAGIAFKNAGVTAAQLGHISTTTGLQISDDVGTSAWFKNRGLSLGGYFGNTPPASGLILDGNVGIGTTNPQQLLELAQPGGGVLRLSNTTDGAQTTGVPIGNIEFYTFDADGAHVGANIKAINEETFGRNTGLAFGTQVIGGSVTERMRIDNAGNVGIGTTNPEAKLHIERQSADPQYFDAARMINARTDSFTTLRMGEQIGSGATDKTAYWAYFNSGWAQGDTVRSQRRNSASLSLGAGATGGFSFVSGLTAPIVFFSGDNEVMDIVNGNVGIGTTAPGAKLDIGGLGNGSMALRTGVYGDAPNYSLRLNTLETGELPGFGAITYAWRINNAGSANDREVMAFKYNGNVGIGTTGPASKLEVAGTVHSTTGGFKFPDGTIQTTAGGGSSQWTTSGTSIYYNTGNVGIGTTGPQFKLEVAGGSLNAYNSATLGSELTAGAWYNHPTIYAYDTFASSGSNITSAITDGSAPAGISDRAWSSGTTYVTPGARFVITGTLTLNSGQAPYVELVDSFLNNTYSSNAQLTNGAFSVTIIGTTEVSTGALAVWNDAAANWSISNLSMKEVQGGNVIARGLFTGGGANGIKVTNAGNVGIGTTAPGAKLTISGATAGIGSAAEINYHIIRSGSHTATSSNIRVIRLPGAIGTFRVVARTPGGGEYTTQEYRVVNGGWNYPNDYAFTQLASVTRGGGVPAFAVSTADGGLGSMDIQITAQSGALIYWSFDGLTESLAATEQ